MIGLDFCFVSRELNSKLHVQFFMFADIHNWELAATINERIRCFLVLAYHLQLIRLSIESEGVLYFGCDLSVIYYERKRYGGTI